MAPEAAQRPAFYALRPGGWRDLVTLLHPPYTAWHLSYVALVLGAYITLGLAVAFGLLPAASLLASQGTCTPPPDTTTFPQTYTGWQCLTSKTTGSPYFASDDLCTGQCWYDNVVYTPPGLPDDTEAVVATILPTSSRATNPTVKCPSSNLLSGS